MLNVFNNKNKAYILVLTLMGTALLLITITAFIVMAMKGVDEANLYRNGIGAEWELERVTLLLKAELKWKIAQNAKAHENPNGSDSNIIVYRPEDTKSTQFWKFWEGITNEGSKLLPVEVNRPINNTLSDADWGKMLEQTGWKEGESSDWRALDSRLTVERARRPFKARFRFSVHEEGSKLNANIAGLGNILPIDRTAPRGSVVNADLLQDPSTQKNFVDMLQKFRWGENFGSSTFEKQKILSQYGSNGFQKIPEKMNTFLDRADYLEFCKQMGVPIQTENFTTFSKDLNGPTWMPTINGSTYPTYRFNNIFTYKYKDECNAPYSATIRSPNRDLANARDSEGKVLLRKRFPLSRLKLLEEATGAVGNDSDIFKYFGLTRAAKGAPWVYEHGTVDANGNTKIYQLNDPEFLARKRDPDFFELLQAGILAGSLGLTSDSSDTRPADLYNRLMFRSTFMEAEFQRPDMANHILSIGANLIDQSDADSYPTNIQFKGRWFPSSGIASDSSNYILNAQNVTVCGQEAIPFISELFTPIFSPGLDTTVNAYITFEVWNPYRYSTSQKPIKIRTSIKGGQVCAGGIVRTLAPAVWANTSPASSAIIDFSVGSHYVEYQSSLSGFRPYRFKTLSDFTSHTADVVTHSNSGYSFSGFDLGSVSYASFVGNFNTSAHPVSLASLSAKTLWIQNEYLNEQGQPIPFQVLPGGYHQNAWNCGSNFTLPGSLLEPSGGWPRAPGPIINSRNLASQIVLGTSIIYNSLKYTYKVNQFYGGENACMYFDPRTSRIGMQNGELTSNDNHPCLNPAIDSNSDMPLKTRWGENAFFRYSGTINKIKILADNKINSGGGYYTDPDMIVRRGDGNASLGVYPNDWTRESDKPVILNRPLRSVAEMGYAYRDLPWKSLNFFSADSADAALLDLFCVEDDTEITSGKLDLNLVKSKTLQSLMEMASLDPFDEQQVITKSDSVTSLIETKSGGQFFTRSELATRLTEFYPEAGSPNQAIKCRREGVVRAVVDSVQTRTANLMFNIYLQLGPYKDDKMKVRGESHQWYHVAIDRFTGEIVSEEFEEPCD